MVKKLHIGVLQFNSLILVSNASMHLAIENNNKTNKTEKNLFLSLNLSFIFINYSLSLILSFTPRHTPLNPFHFLPKRERRNFMKQLKQIKGLEEQIGVEERKRQKDECGTIRKMA